MNIKINPLINRFFLLPEYIRALVLTISIAGISLVFWKYQRMMFLLSLSGVLVTTTAMLFDPFMLSLLLVLVSNATSMSYILKFGQITVYPYEPIILTLIISLFLTFLIRGKKNFLMPWSPLHTATSIFLAFHLISAVIGFLRGYLGLGFRAELLRGPNYYWFFFLFSFLCANYEGASEKLARWWLLSSFVGSAIFVLAHILQYTGAEVVEYATLFQWGFHIQVFVFSIGMTFLLGIMKNKKWWIVTFLQIAMLTYTRKRTPVMAAILMIAMLTFFYAFILQGNRRWKFIRNSLIGAGIFAVFFKALSNLLFTQTQSMFALELISRFGVLMKPKSLLLIPSLQVRFFEYFDAFHILRDSGYLFGSGLGVSFLMFPSGTTYIIDGVFFMVLTKMGILGLLSFLGMFTVFACLCMQLIRNLDKIKSVFMKAFVINAFISIPVSLTIGLAISHLWSAGGTIIMTTLFMAVCAHLWKTLPKENAC